MRKFLIATCIVMCASTLMAQLPQVPTEPVDNTGNYNPGYGIRGDLAKAPIAPATLLLLGLGGAAVGTMVYRNTKNKKEE